MDVTASSGGGGGTESSETGRLEKQPPPILTEKGIPLATHAGAPRTATDLEPICADQALVSAASTLVMETQADWRRRARQKDGAVEAKVLTGGGKGGGGGGGGGGGAFFLNHRSITSLFVLFLLFSTKKCSKNVVRSLSMLGVGGGGRFEAIAQSKS